MSEIVVIGTEEIDIQLPKNLSTEIVAEHLGVLSRALSYEVGVYEEMAKTISGDEGKFRSRKTRFEGLEQIFIASFIPEDGEKKPTVDAIKGKAKSHYSKDFKAILVLEENVVAQKILMEAQSRRIKSIEMQIMIRQALLKSIDADIRNNAYQS